MCQLQGLSVSHLWCRKVLCQLGEAGIPPLTSHSIVLLPTEMSELDHSCTKPCWDLAGIDWGHHSSSSCPQECSTGHKHPLCGAFPALLQGSWGRAGAHPAGLSHLSACTACRPFWGSCGSAAAFFLPSNPCLSPWRPGQLLAFSPFLWLALPVPHGV